MRDVNKIFNIITLYVVILISIGILGTFLSDYLISIKWFGDKIASEKTGAFIFDNVEYGARHYWYNWGIGILMFVSVFRVVVSVGCIIENKK